MRFASPKNHPKCTKFKLLRSPGPRWGSLQRFQTP